MEIRVDGEAVAAICRHHGVRRLSFYGSVLGHRFRPGSDVDVLVEYEEGQDVSFFEMHDLQEELEALLGLPVDLHTPRELSRHFRGHVLAEAQEVYAS